MHAEQGQYRSKIMLTPDADWGEGVQLTIEELEEQMGSIADAYAKSSAGRHLARHFVEQKQYDKAVAYYLQSLQVEGLSAIANREMLRELAQVQLLQKEYSAAIASLEKVLSIDLVAAASDYLLLARAHYHLKNYLGVVASLDRVQADGVTFDPTQMRQAVALYYSAGAYEQCETLLQGLLQLEPGEPSHWHRLAAVYVQQNKRVAALDLLTLAHDKAVPFTAAELMLLADLHAVNKNPYRAAEILAEGIARESVQADGSSYRKLFEFWFQAREHDKAREALQHAAQLTRDPELYLYLAQLHMERESWSAMYQTMVAGCARELPDRYVGKANLLLGISQLKSGDATAARRSFINATLISGVNAQAGQWLDFINAAPATASETRIESICFGSQDKRTRVSGKSSATGSATQVAVATKTAPGMRLFYAQYHKPLTEMAGQLRSQGINLNLNLVKAGGTADGPLHLIIASGWQEQLRDPNWQLGLPISGAVVGRGRFRTRAVPPFLCAYQVFEGLPENLVATLRSFALSAQNAGHSFTGEARLLILAGSSAENLKVEIQLGTQ